MNFLDKIGKSRKSKLLSFLEKYDFEPNETCGYGCCKGYYKAFYSGDKSYYNRVTVYCTYVDSNKVKIEAVCHKEYDCGGLINTSKDSEVLYGEIEEDLILRIINDVLPDDLD